MFTSKIGLALFLLPFAKRHLSMLVLMAGLIAITLAPSSGVHAQTECLGACEERLVACIAQSGDNPMLESNCQDKFEACVDACLSRYALILG